MNGPAATRFAALAGAVAAAVAIGLSELIAGLVPAVPSLVASIGQTVIDLQPPGAKDFVVGLFGQNDKLALELFIVAVALVVAAGVGIVARRSFAFGAAGFVVAGIGGAAAALRDTRTEALPAIVAAAVASVAGIQTLSWLIARIPDAPRDPASADMPNWSRRAFLGRSAAVAVVAVAAGGVGRMLIDTQQRATEMVMTHLPHPGRIATLPPGAELAVAGVTPIVVPNGRFYRIDTALLVPSVDVSTWRLRVHGLVDREVTLTFDELTALGTVEQYVTIACVSNVVGGDLVGNAKWTGVPLRTVLDMASVQASATQLVGRSVDGWTAGMPTAWVMASGREPLIAVAMNDEPLPREHGFPVRLIVPGLYGYVSATKWLSELELTTLEAFDAYWVPLGWAKEAPILTQSRIDVPRRGRSVPAGATTVAGVAWAPDRGVSRVEVAIDGAWQPATLSTPISAATWVQWRTQWSATPGHHTIAVRATDGRGATQEDQPTPPAPDGARGYHTIEVDVT
jgi:DMSO/TMAO reductase YedYZ molybdopterin-dependent catalytic subunit